jgi:hypothetical protein
MERGKGHEQGDGDAGSDDDGGAKVAKEKEQDHDCE